MTALPSPADITRALVPALEGSTLHLDETRHPYIWEAMTHADKPGELHLDVGYRADSWDVVLKVESIRPHQPGQDEWRVGNCQPQNLYEGDRFAGAMLKGEDAQRIASALNVGRHDGPAWWANRGRLLLEAAHEVGYLFAVEDAARIVAVMNGDAS